MEEDVGDGKAQQSAEPGRFPTHAGARGVRGAERRERSCALSRFAGLAHGYGHQASPLRESSNTARPEQWLEALYQSKRSTVKGEVAGCTVPLS